MILHIVTSIPWGRWPPELVRGCGRGQCPLQLVALPACLAQRREALQGAAATSL